MTYLEDYIAMRDRHLKDIANFPIGFAFNQKQLEQVLNKLNATKDECCSIFGCGDILRKSDVKAYKKMTYDYFVEMMRAMRNKDFAKEAFMYEMANYEYEINVNGDEEVTRCFGLSMNTLSKYGLDDVYQQAKQEYLIEAKENSENDNNRQ